MGIVFQTARLRSEPPTRWGNDMSFLDKAKSALGKAVDSKGEQIADGLEKAGDLADKKTGGKYSDKIDQGVEKTKDALDGLDGKDDDIR
jgi:hypothetical protein